MHLVITKQQTLDAREGKEWRDGCSVPLQHKRLLLTPALLRTTSVRFQVLGQKSGDLVYVGLNELHHVINLNVNLAEAVNVGSSLWNVAADRFRPCYCEAEEDRPVNNIPQNSSWNCRQPLPAFLRLRNTWLTKKRFFVNSVQINDRQKIKSP